MASGNYSFPKTIEGKIFINNKFVKPHSTVTSTVYNGKDNSIVTDKHVICDRDDVNLAVAAARKALNGSWSEFTGLQRARCLYKLADLLEQNAEEAAYYESICSGRIMDQLRTEVPWIADVIRYYAGWADKLEGEYLPDDDGFVKIVRHEPVGVCGGITPWNGPLMVFVMKGAPALAVGNTFVLKPPEKSPLSSLFAASLLSQAGFPEGVFNVVTGDGNTGALISGHMEIDMVSFTGSVEIGRTIAAAANASNMKRVTLELGGKSPAIIFPDADLPSAIQWASKGVTMNAGQVCVAPSRVYVHESIADELIAGVKTEFERLGSTLGLDPQQYGTTFGPVIDKSQFDRIYTYIEEGKKDATLLTGGYKHDKPGNYIPPTLFTDPDPTASIYRDEIFGPVLCIRRFTEEEEAIKLANDTSYGLAAYIFTEDTKRIFRVTKQLQAGIVGVNALNMLFPNAPFGGYKSSGVGKELGKYALRDYSATKTIYIKSVDNTA
ncbi:Aldehyde/histidinol dehydrogenase [Aspergillus sergii]|uniref:aldehyde dehydrogenase (NAD(+)) n=1 Tax=Aspergillus sergii TaxID=1034303 RepID=A0A5N6XFA9_9EURO|nr:Aldehyde/histidinol dehydrogenase [Aspergillus sergii]